MNKKLTDSYSFVKKFDALAAEIYIDIKWYLLKPERIAEYRKITLPEVEALYSKAKGLLKDRNQAWLYGLSPRAKLAIIATEKYKDFADLYNDVMGNNTDLEALPKIGHKSSLEIHGWIIRHCKAKQVEIKQVESSKT